MCGFSLKVWRRGLSSAIEGDSFDAYRCVGCDSIVSWPLAVPDGLYDAIYRSSPQLAGYQRYARYASRCENAHDALAYLAGQEDMYWAVSEVLRGNPESKSWRIVEIGSGLGYLTAALNGAGYDVTGLDISTEAVAKARRRFGAHYEQQDVLNPDPRLVGAFDFAIVLETIEHVPDPKSFLHAVTRLLRPTGSVLVTTPNRDAHPHEASWRTDPPPVHLYWMTEAAVVGMASDIGYTANLIDFSPFNARHRQTVSRGNLDATPPPMLTRAMEPCTTVPFRTRFMERARALPPLARASRLLYDHLRPKRMRLTSRSASLAAVLSPMSMRELDGDEPALSA
jgi:SAM-dependent methyltransferase